MAVRIPKQTVAGLANLASLSDEQFAKVRSAIESIPTVIKQRSIFEDSGVKPEGIDFDSIRNGIYPLLLGVATIPVPLSEYIQDVVRAVREEAEPKPSEQALTSLETRLNELFNIPSTKLIAKAYDVLLEHGCAYVNARVLSDIRPVFGDDVGEQPKAAVVVHMLNIDHLEGSNRKTLAVALDTKDVDQLIEALERAKKKAESLKLLLASSGLSYIDVV